SVAGGWAPNSAKLGARYSSQRACRAGSAGSGAWQNRFTPNGRSVRARVWTMACRAAAASLAPSPSEPSPPAFETAAASAGVLTPAMGAWMMGVDRPRRWTRLGAVEADGMRIPVRAGDLQATVLECVPDAKGAG